MNSTIAACAIIAWGALWAALVAAAPWTISDHNAFLKGFVNEQFLSFMGVVVTITLASASNLYLELNKLEDKADKTIFTSTKRHIRHSAYVLVSALVAALVLVIVKPLLGPGPRFEAAANGCCISIILVSVLVLIDLVQATFGLDPRG